MEGKLNKSRKKGGKKKQFRGKFCQIFIRAPKSRQDREFLFSLDALKSPSSPTPHFRLPLSFSLVFLLQFQATTQKTKGLRIRWSLYLRRAQVWTRSNFTLVRRAEEQSHLNTRIRLQPVSFNYNSRRNRHQCRRAQRMMIR